MENKKEILIEKILAFMIDEARSCSMEPETMTAEYIARMWGGKVPVDEITEVLEDAKKKYRQQ